MEYYASFKESGIVDCYYRKESEAEHPTFIKDTVYSLTEEQYNLQRFLILNGDIVEWKQPEYTEYLNKDARKVKIKASKDKLKKLKNADVDKLGNKRLEAIIKDILDVLTEREELSDVE